MLGRGVTVAGCLPLKKCNGCQYKVPCQKQVGFDQLLCVCVVCVVRVVCVGGSGVVCGVCVVLCVCVVCSACGVCGGVRCSVWCVCGVVCVCVCVWCVVSWCSFAGHTWKIS